MASTAGVASTAKRTLSAVSRILSPSAPVPITPSKVSFRSLPTSTAGTTLPAQDQSSISGLKFCLHMVFFAAPGIVISKRLAEGERVEDMVEEAKTTFNNLVDSLS